MAVPLCPPGLAKQTFPRGWQFLVLLPGLLPKLSLCSCQRLPLNFTAIPGVSLSTRVRTCLHPPVTPVLCPKLLLASGASHRAVTAPRHSHPTTLHPGFSKLEAASEPSMFTRPPPTLCCFCIQWADKVPTVKYSPILSLLGAALCTSRGRHSPASV